MIKYTIFVASILGAVGAFAEAADVPAFEAYTSNGVVRIPVDPKLVKQGFFIMAGEGQYEKCLQLHSYGSLLFFSVTDWSKCQTALGNAAPKSTGCMRGATCEG